MSTHRQNPRKRPLQVESLESLTLLSGLASLGAVQAPALISAASTSRLSFSGTTTGTFGTSQTNPDTGKSYQMVTQGKTTIGTPITVNGELQTPGFIARGRVTGTLTVTTAKGTLTLAVSSAPLPGFSPLPSRLTYRIVDGTGVFLNNHRGSGTISVAYQVTGSTATGGLPGQVGTIKLVFRAA